MNDMKDTSSQPEHAVGDAPQRYTVTQHLLPGIRPTYKAAGSQHGVVTIIEGLAVQANSPDVFSALAEIFADAARELAYTQAQVRP
jgi:hypothetical protein